MIFACGKPLDEVAKCIENYIRMAMNWFKLNELVANPEKFKLIFFGIKEDHELSICNVLKLLAEAGDLLLNL